MHLTPGRETDRLIAEALGCDVWVEEGRWVYRRYRPLPDGYSDYTNYLPAFSTSLVGAQDLRELVYRRCGIALPWRPEPIQTCEEVLSLGKKIYYRPGMLTRIFGKKQSAIVSPGRRFRILKRDGYRCQICGRSAEDGVKLEIDHKTPRAKGGMKDDDNLWTLCWDCNRGKRDCDL